jgi:carboxyl-terminal processing protease
VSRKATLTVVIIAVLLGVTLFYGSYQVSSQGEERGTGQESIGTVLEVIALVKTRHYYQPVSTFDLIKGWVLTGTINGMLRHALEDPYTRHMDAIAFENMMNTTTGVYGGIGLSVGILDERVTVVSPIKGTPASGRAAARGQDRSH